MEAKSVHRQHVIVFNGIQIHNLFWRVLQESVTQSVHVYYFFSYSLKREVKIRSQHIRHKPHRYVTPTLDFSLLIATSVCLQLPLYTIPKPPSPSTRLWSQLSVANTSSSYWIRCMKVSLESLPSLLMCCMDIRSQESHWMLRMYNQTILCKLKQTDSRQTNETKHMATKK